MEGKILIYGEVTHEQISDAQSWGCTNLISVNEQIKAQPDATSFIVEINSIGGTVSEGLAIYQRLREVSKSGIPITTQIKGQCASIATIIFLSGDTRKVNEFFEPFVHEVQGGVQGSNTEIQDYAKVTQHLTNKLLDLYENRLTIPREEIEAMMKAETYISPEKAVQIGFATEVEEVLSPSAKLNIVDKYSKMKKDEFSKEDKGVIARFLNSLGLGKNEPIKNIIVKSADQKDIDFYEREEGEPEIGDKAKIDGNDAEGEVTVANGDVYVFEAGELKDILKKQEEDVDALKAEINSLKEQLQNANSEVETKKTAFDNLKTENDALKTQHTELTNKLKAFSSNMVIDTVEPTPKPKQKKTLAERAKALSGRL